MLVKLTPEQCMAFWSPIKEGIIKGMPSFRVSQEGMLSIQQQLLIDDMQCWMYVDRIDKDTGRPSLIEAILTTKVIKEIATGDLSLCIYSLFSKDKLSIEDYKSGLFAVTNFAKARGCKHIVAYTNVEYIKDIFKQLGGDASWSILNFQLGE